VLFLVKVQQLLKVFTKLSVVILVATVRQNFGEIFRIWLLFTVRTKCYRRDLPQLAVLKRPVYESPLFDRPAFPILYYNKLIVNSQWTHYLAVSDISWIIFFMFPRKQDL